MTWAGALLKGAFLLIGNSYDDGDYDCDDDDEDW